MHEASYTAEAVLQTLVASHPELLSGEGSDRRLLLVRREAGVKDAADGQPRWALDRLFLDAEGVPVLVDVKRAFVRLRIRRGRRSDAAPWNGSDKPASRELHHAQSRGSTRGSRMLHIILKRILKTPTAIEASVARDWGSGLKCGSKRLTKILEQQWPLEKSRRYPSWAGHEADLARFDVRNDLVDRYAVQAIMLVAARVSHTHRAEPRWPYAASNPISLTS